MITDGHKKWHYLAVRSLSIFYKDLYPSHDDEYYCMNCPYSFRNENKNLNHMKIYAKVMIIVT